MTDERDLGPPRNDADRPFTQGPATAAESENSTNHRPDPNRSTCHAASDTLAALRRRRGAAARMQPLSCGHVDPWICDCFAQPVSDNMAEAAVAAIVYLDELGAPGLLDRDTCRAMHRVGYRALAFEVYCRSTGAA